MRGRCHALLVASFTMNDAGNTLGGIGTHAGPHFHYITAGRIHELYTFLFQTAAQSHGNTECRNNHHVLLRQYIIGGVIRTEGQMAQAHGIQTSIDCGVVNNLTDKPNTLTGKHIAGSVSNLNSALHTITKTE